MPNTHRSESGYGTVGSYTAGFIISILLTLTAYLAATNLSGGTLVTTLVLLATIQLIVQLVFFLHLGSESNPRWNLIALLFAVLTVSILVTGTIWIMYHLNYNMLPPAQLNTYILQQEAIPK